MRLLTLALLLVAQADDPPFLAAARERQAKAKAFEATLSFEHSVPDKEVLLPRRERKDFTITGHDEFMMDKEKWRCRSDMPSQNAFGLVILKWEGSFNGGQTRLTIRRPIINGPRAGEWNTQCHVHNEEFRGFMGSQFFPLLWVLRGTEPQSKSDPGSVLSSRADCTPWELVEGPLQQIGNHLCQEYRRRSLSRQSVYRLWVCPELGHVPVKYQDSNDSTVVEYRPDPELGGVPTGWTRTEGRLPMLRITHRRVRVDSFKLRDSFPAESFTLAFPPGSTVSEIRGNQTNEFKVSEDGSLVPVPRKPEPAPPQAQLPSLHESLWVVGVAVAVFVGFVVLLKRVARSRTDDSANSAGSRNLPT